MDNKNFSHKAIIGIVSGLIEHKLAWVLQSNLNIVFSLDTDLIDLPVYKSEWQGYKLYLIANKAYNKVSFPKLKKIDYFLIIDNKTEAEIINQILKKVKDIIYTMIIDEGMIPEKYRKILERIS